MIRCGHVFVLHCAADGIATDGVLINNNKKPDISINEEKNDGSKVRFYEAGNASSLDGLMSLYKSFLQESAKYFKGKWSSFRRAKPLISLDPTSFFPPDIDDEAKESVLKELLSEVYSIADEFGVDIALCVQDESTCMSMNRMRSEACPFEGGPFWMLSESQKSAAFSLAETAKLGRLAIFFGAGISIPSGRHPGAAYWMLLPWRQE